MKKGTFYLLFAAISSFIALSFVPDNFLETDSDPIKWYSWDEAVAASKENPKKILVDVYTDWCGWCKVMDKKTFADPKIAEYINEHFYPIKFNAEGKEKIQFNGQEFKHVEAGRRGIHTLAYSLLDGKMSYPSFVFLTEDFERVKIVKGFKDADGFMKELVYTAEEQYKPAKDRSK